MKIVYTKSVTKDVRKIKDKKLIVKIEETIKKLKSASKLDELNDVAKLSGHPLAYRLRIGNYRMGFYHESGIITLVRFLKRNDIYKVFP